MNYVPKIDRRSFVVSAAAMGGGLALGLDLPFGPQVIRAQDGSRYSAAARPDLKKSSATPPPNVEPVIEYSHCTTTPPRGRDADRARPKPTTACVYRWRYAMRRVLITVVMMIGLAVPTAASAGCSGVQDMCIPESSSKMALYDGALGRLGQSLSTVHQAAVSCESRCRRIQRQPARSVCFCECAGGIPHVFRGRVLCE